ncbi:hypothetical protein M0R45_021012 [Rubus argutus]|uniref:Endonuclease/exonuclease/phosphatase domain-containing protein n=1 Tax=Rubus argutus TaxID=59490 RepID=A0AAW1XB06_RUBAR
MKVLYWNLRGIANAPTQNALKKFVRVHSPEVLCISEPFVALDSIPSSFWSSFNMVVVGTNDRGGLLPNLWVLCKTSIFQSVIILSVTDQQVTFQILMDSTPCVLTAVYAKTTIVGRRNLWLDIAFVKSSFVTGPWIVFGDFNAVLGAHEKKGGAHLCRQSCEEFQTMSDTCELAHVATKGAQFTWARRRGVRGNVELRLDRCLANFNWLDCWDTFDCSTLPRFCSDHNPLLMSFSKSFGPRQSLFRFHKMWIEHKDFYSFVKQRWDSVNTYGCPLLILQHKLRVLRKALRSWNWEVFGDVHRKVDADLANLEALQLSIAASGGSDVEFAKEVELQANLADSMRIRKAHASINCLKEGDRVFEDPVSIQNHIVDYYKVLFSDHGGCVDTGLVSRVIPSLVTEVENASLIALPSPEEIFSAVKAMDPDSAPGPDGFNGHFFLSCWDIVGKDVSAAVQYFFSYG